MRVCMALCFLVNTCALGRVWDLRDGALQQRPEALHRAALAQVLGHAVPVEVEHAQRRAAAPPPRTPHALSKMLRQQQLVLALRAAARAHIKRAEAPSCPMYGCCDTVWHTFGISTCGA